MDKENSPHDDFLDNDLCAKNKLHAVFLIIIIQINRTSVQKSSVRRIWKRIV